jgi:hypothetical protein
VVYAKRKRIGSRGSSSGRVHVETDWGKECKNLVGRNFCEYHMDAFTVTDKKFLNVFRVPRVIVRQLVARLTPVLAPKQKQVRKDFIDVTERVLLALIYTSTTGGETAKNHLLTGRGASTIRESADMVASAVNTLYRAEVIRMPESDEISDMCAWFEAERGMPMCMGGLDGKHFATTAGKEDFASLTNFHGWRSMNVLG